MLPLQLIVLPLINKLKFFSRLKLINNKYIYIKTLFQLYDGISIKLYGL